MAGTSKWTAEQKEACYAATDRGLSKAQVARELNRLFSRCGKVFDEGAVKYALGLRGKGSKSGDASGSRAGLSAPFMTPANVMSHPSSATPNLSRLPTGGWSYPHTNFEIMGQQQYGLNTSPNPTCRQSTPNNGPLYAQADLGNMYQQQIGLNTDLNPTYRQVTQNNDSFYPPPNLNHMGGYQQQHDRRAHLSCVPCHLPRDAPSASSPEIRLAESHSAEEFANSIFETQHLQSKPMNEIPTSTNWGFSQPFGNMRERFNPNMQMPNQGIYAAASYLNPQDGTTFLPPTVSQSGWMSSDDQERLFQHYGSGTFLHPDSGSVSGPPVGIRAGISGYPRHDQKAPPVVTLPGYGQSSDNLGRESQRFMDFDKTSMLPSSARQAHSSQPLGNSSPLSTFRTGNQANISLAPSKKSRCTIAGNNKVACVSNFAGSHATEEACMTDPPKRATESNLRITTAAVSMLEPSLLDLRPKSSPVPIPCLGSAPHTSELTQPATATSKTHIPMALKPSTNSRHNHLVHHQRSASQQIERPVQALAADHSAAVFSSGTCLRSAPTDQTAINEHSNRPPIKRKREGAEMEAAGAVESPAKKQGLREDSEVKSDDIKRELLLHQARCDLKPCGPEDVVPRKILEPEDFLLKLFERVEDNPAPVYCPSDAMLAECYNSEVYEGLMLWRDLSIKCEEISYIPCGPSLEKGGDELAEAVADGTFRELIARKFAEFEGEMQKIRDYEAKAYKHRMDGTKRWMDFGYFGPARYASPDTYRTLFR